MKQLKLIIAVLLAMSPLAAQADTINWTDWTSITFGESATGNMGGVSVTVTGNLNGPSQTGCGTNYWTEPNAADPAYTGGSADNAPSNCEQVGLNSATSISVTFGSPVDNLFMALLSVGQPGVAVTYDFDQSFVIDSEGQGAWGNDAFDGVMGANDTLVMREFHGVLLFSGPVSTLTFTTDTPEYWHAFTFGTAASSVPEPGTLALLGLGLVGMAARRRKTV